MGEQFPKDQTNGNNSFVTKQEYEAIGMKRMNEEGEGKGGVLSRWIKGEQEYVYQTVRTDNDSFERDKYHPSKMTGQVEPWGEDTNVPIMCPSN